MQRRGAVPAGLKLAAMSKKTTATAAPDAPPAAADDAVSRFEGSMKELESIVARMERGDLPLEESLSLFERGMQLTRECRTSLDRAELRVRKLLDANGDPAAAPASE
ncbi:MAG: hypothetical protein NVS9B10_29070 [Nevskia sp.]